MLRSGSGCSKQPATDSDWQIVALLMGPGA
jgi:hypothetical protein